MKRVKSMEVKLYQDILGFQSTKQCANGTYASEKSVTGVNVTNNCGGRSTFILLYYRVVQDAHRIVRDYDNKVNHEMNPIF